MNNISNVGTGLPRKRSTKMLMRALDWILRPLRPAGQRYALTFLAALLAMLLNWGLWPWVKEMPYGIPFTLALLVLVYGGFGPSFLTAITSCLTTDFFLLN